MPSIDATLADLIVGPHCELTEWVFEAITRMVERHSPHRACGRIDRFDRVSFLADRRSVLFTNYPSLQLVDAIERDEVRLILVVEEPRKVLAFMTKRLGLPVMEAIRSQTASAVANLAIGRSKNALIVSRQSTRTLGEIVRRIATHFSITVSDADVTAIVASGAQPRSPATPLSDFEAPGGESGALAASPLAPDRRLVEACETIMDPLLAMAGGDRVRPVVWPTPVFKFSGQPDEPAPTSARIAGPARNLYYGPYLYLPPARYRVEALLEFSNEIANVPFVIDVHGGGWLAKARIVERRAGGFRGYFYLDHREPTSTVEIRLRNESAVDDGRLALIELSFFVAPLPDQLSP